MSCHYFHSPTHLIRFVFFILQLKLFLTFFFFFCWYLLNSWVKFCDNGCGGREKYAGSLGYQTTLTGAPLGLDVTRLPHISKDRGTELSMSTPAHTLSSLPSERNYWYRGFCLWSHRHSSASLWKQQQQKKTITTLLESDWACVSGTERERERLRDVPLQTSKFIKDAVLQARKITAVKVLYKPALAVTCCLNTDRRN